MAARFDETPPGGVRNVRWGRPLLQFALDSVGWAAALVLSTILRYDFHWSQVTWDGLAATVPLAITAQGCLGLVFGLYRRRWRYGSFDEVTYLACTALAVGVLLTCVVWIPSGSMVPRSVPLLATCMALTAMLTVRSVRRMLRSHRNRPLLGKPIVIAGAGQAAVLLVQNLLSFPKGAYRPVALLDDNPFKSDLRVQGIRVEGTLSDLSRVAKRHNAQAVLLAIPTGGSELVRYMNCLAREAGLPLLVLPPVADMFGAPTSSDIRPVTEADLLGRDTADIDPDAVAHYITGKRVLVTGAGGSIGSELCRQIARFEPSELYMLDRDESGLHAVQLSIEGRALLNTPNLVLADIRDEQRLMEAFRRFRPEVVFHAAALKHLTLLELAPDEAWKTNVFGTDNVLRAAESVGVERFVNISTDKAADPTSVLGWSKRVTERLTAHHASSKTGTYVSVRFGNVLGSRGSVLTIFRAQSEAGGPITVTHPEVTRFFMTVEEAVRLTIYAGAIGEAGQVMVLDMGEPVRIAAVAERFATQREPPLEIVFTGLRPGEKLHEDLIATDEADVRPIHPLITHVPVPPLSIDDVRWVCGGELTCDTLQRVVLHGIGANHQTAS
ncbi:MAG: polysaccharide biosynthesis protein [Acidimicrobiia bacterium]